MKDPYSTKHIVRKLFTLTTLTTATLMAIGISISNWQPGFAQVADWCSQPGILWCTSHDEPEFSVDQNLSSSDKYAGPVIGWYASGGYIDRNESQYPNSITNTQPFFNALAAKVTQASTSAPARSGETNGKRYLSLSLNTSYDQASTEDEGIFLSRPISSGNTSLITAHPNGLY